LPPRAHCQTSNPGVSFARSHAHRDLAGRTIAGYRLLERVGEGGTGRGVRASTRRRGTCAFQGIAVAARERPHGVKRFLREQGTARGRASWSRPHLRLRRGRRPYSSRSNGPKASPSPNTYTAPAPSLHRWWRASCGSCRCAGRSAPGGDHPPRLKARKHHLTIPNRSGRNCSTSASPRDAELPPKRAPHATDLVGTLKYVAPEPCRGSWVDVGADILQASPQSLSVLTGQAPANRPDAAELFQQLLTQTGGAAEPDLSGPAIPPRA